jgi:hypothetical protein
MSLFYTNEASKKLFEKIEYVSTIENYLFIFLVEMI